MEREREREKEIFCPAEHTIIRQCLSLSRKSYALIRGEWQLSMPLLCKVRGDCLSPPSQRKLCFRPVCSFCRQPCISPLCSEAEGCGLSRLYVVYHYRKTERDKEIFCPAEQRMNRQFLPFCRESYAFVSRERQRSIPLLFKGERRLSLSPFLERTMTSSFPFRGRETSSIVQR